MAALGAGVSCAGCGFSGDAGGSGVDAASLSRASARARSAAASTKSSGAAALVGEAAAKARARSRARIGLRGLASPVAQSGSESGGSWCAFLGLVIVDVAQALSASVTVAGLAVPVLLSENHGLEGDACSLVAVEGVC